MEVSLVSKRGVPEDAIISIRSGAVRRQGAVASDKPFRFPGGASEADCVVKVDIMQNIGSGYLVMRPNQKDDKQYEVVMSNNSDMVCDLAVKTLDASPAPVPVSPEEAAAAAKTKGDAKAYLENTGLLPFVQGVLQVVAKQQPEDPFAAMAKHFLSASDEAVPPQTGSPKAAPAVPKPVVEEAPAAESTEEPAKAAVPVEEAVAPASPIVEEAKAAPPVEEQEAAVATEKAAEEKPAEEQSMEVKATEEAPAEEKPAEEAKAEAAAAEEDKAESDHVDENKSDTLEEFTSKVNEASNAGEALAGAAAVLAGAPAGVAVAAAEAANDAGEAAKAEEPVAGEAAVADDSANAAS